MIITSNGGCDYPKCGHLYPDCLDLKGVLRQHQINNQGYKQGDDGVSYEEFYVCANWIMNNRMRNRNRKWSWQSSYGLKHIVEAETHTYIPNGAFIAAGILLGLKWRYTRGPNVGFFMPPAQVTGKEKLHAEQRGSAR